MAACSDFYFHEKYVRSRGNQEDATKKIRKENNDHEFFFFTWKPLKYNTHATNILANKDFVLQEFLQVIWKKLFEKKHPRA